MTLKQIPAIDKELLDSLMRNTTAQTHNEAIARAVKFYIRMENGDQMLQDAGEINDTEVDMRWL